MSVYHRRGIHPIAPCLETRLALPTFTQAPLQKRASAKVLEGSNDVGMTCGDVRRLGARAISAALGLLLTTKSSYTQTCPTHSEVSYQRFSIIFGALMS